MPEKLIFPNEFLLNKAVQAVEEGRVATIPVLGHSMDPFIHGGHDCVELYPATEVQVGDVVLARVNGEQFLLHRIFRFEGKEGVVLMGDGNPGTKEYCLRKDIKAKALVIVSEKGKRTRIDSRGMKIAARIWRFLLPVRFSLLRVFRKTCR